MTAPTTEGMRGLLLAATEGGPVLSIGAFVAFIGMTLVFAGVLMPFRMGRSLPSVKPFARYCRLIGVPTFAVGLAVVGISKL